MTTLGGGTPQNNTVSGGSFGDFQVNSPASTGITQSSGGFGWFGTIMFAASIGYWLYNLFFGKKAEKPEKQDFSSNNYSRNNVVPIVYGTDQVTGSLMFIGNAEAKLVKSESSSSSKGMPTSSSYSGYEYYIEAAIGICEGEISSVNKFYLNDDEIADTDYSFDLVHYMGSEDQEIEVGVSSFLGEHTDKDGAVPWMNTAYTYFSGSLGSSNNLPTVKHEVTGLLADSNLPVGPFKETGELPIGIVKLQEGSDNNANLNMMNVPQSQRLHIYNNKIYIYHSLNSGYYTNRSPWFSGVYNGYIEEHDIVSTIQITAITKASSSSYYTPMIITYRILNGLDIPDSGKLYFRDLRKSDLVFQYSITDRSNKIITMPDRGWSDQYCYLNFGSLPKVGDILEYRKENGDFSNYSYIDSDADWVAYNGKLYTVGYYFLLHCGYVPIFYVKDLKTNIVTTYDPASEPDNYAKGLSNPWIWPSWSKWTQHHIMVKNDLVIYGSNGSYRRTNLLFTELPVLLSWPAGNISDINTIRQEYLVPTDFFDIHGFYSALLNSGYSCLVKLEDDMATWSNYFSSFPISGNFEDFCLDADGNSYAVFLSSDQRTLYLLRINGTNDYDILDTYTYNSYSGSNPTTYCYGRFLSKIVCINNTIYILSHWCNTSSTSFVYNLPFIIRFRLNIKDETLNLYDNSFYPYSYVGNYTDNFKISRRIGSKLFVHNNKLYFYYSVNGYFSNQFFMGRLFKNNATIGSGLESNPIEVVYDFMTNERYGMGISAEFFDGSPYSLNSGSWYIEAMYCNEQIYNEDTLNYESRFLYSKTLDTKTKAGDFIEDVLQTCRGFLYYCDGKIKVKIQKSTEEMVMCFGQATTTFELNEVASSSTILYIDLNDYQDNFWNGDLGTVTYISGETEIVQNFIVISSNNYSITTYESITAPVGSIVELKKDNMNKSSFTYQYKGTRDVYNRITLTYVDRDDDYNTNIQQEDDVYDIDQTNEIREYSIEMTGIKRGSQAKRLATFLCDYNSFTKCTCSFTLDIIGLMCCVGDIVGIVHENAGWLGKLFRIIEIEELDSLEVKLTCIEYYAGIFTDDYITTSALSESSYKMSSKYDIPDNVTRLKLFESIDYPRIYITFKLPDFNYWAGAEIYKKGVDGSYIFLGINTFTYSNFILDGTLNSTDTTIYYVEDSLYESFPDTGSFWIDNEEIYYGSIDTDNNCFLNCKRGYNNTIADSHETSSVGVLSNYYSFYYTYNEEEIGQTLYFKAISLSTFGIHSNSTGIPEESITIQGYYYLPKSVSCLKLWYI